MSKQITGTTILVVAIAVLGLMTLLVIPMPYSLIPVTTWLVVGGAIVWKSAKQPWLRGIAISAFGGGVILSVIILVLA